MVIDSTDDQLSYGEIVAELNRRSEEVVTVQSVQGENGNRGEEQETAFYVVLCRTNGGAFDFSPWKPVYVVAGPYDCYTLYFASETAAQNAVSELSALPEIRYAEPDAEVEACGEETLSFESQGAELMNYGPYLNWSAGCSAGSVNVAVVDSGVYPHPMYADRMLESGYDYVDADSDATNDPFGHGTNVTGILADCTQNASVYIYPVRVLNEEGKGKVSNSVNGIREAMEHGVDVINLSLAATAGNTTQALDEAVIDALYAGITVVAAAGNNHVDTSQVSPARLTNPGVIVVGACASNGNRAAYSNYGQSVDVYVYGTNIRCCRNDGDYGINSGTSMSAPHISGLASLLLLTHNGSSPDEIETRIRNSTDLSVEINIPDLIRITPDNPGFSLSILKMHLSDSIQLSTQIRPYTAAEPITYNSSDPSVVSIQNGLLIPGAVGTATVRAQSLGLEDRVFDVIVTDEECMTVTLPQNLRTIGEEAFSGVSGIVGHLVLPEGCETVAAGAFFSCEGLKTIELPDSLLNITEGAFSDTVLLCREGSPAESWAREHQQPYILLGD